VNQVIVAVNKLERTEPPWSEERFLKIKAEVISMLKALNFKSDLIRVIPTSGLHGENIYEVSNACPLKQWYVGPTLVEAIDTFKVPPRSAQKPLRAVVLSATPAESKANGYYELRVKVLQGSIRTAKSINLSMNPWAWNVLRIISDRCTDDELLVAGEQGIIRVVYSSGAKDSYVDGFVSGQVISKGSNSVSHVVNAFKATIVTLGNITPILEGSSFQLYLLGEEVECQITKFYRLKSERGVVKYPKVIGAKKAASVKIETSRPISIDTVTTCRALARFALRAQGQICAIGWCSQLPSYESSASLFNVTSSTITT
jgi:translation elongation factor EF-1alpha